jgi:hypothetical protein
VLKAKPVSVQLCLLYVKISLGLPWERTWTFAVTNYFGLCTAGAAVRTSKYCFILDLFVNLWDVSIFFLNLVFSSFNHPEPLRLSFFITKSG